MIAPFFTLSLDTRRNIYSFNKYLSIFTYMFFVNIVAYVLLDSENVCPHGMIKCGHGWITKNWIEDSTSLSKTNQILGTLFHCI